MLINRRKSHKSFLLVVLLTLVISSTIFVSSCKKNDNQEVFEDNGLDVESSNVDRSPIHKVRYKTKKRVIDVGEDLPISISFSTDKDYKQNYVGVFDYVKAELSFRYQYDHQLPKENVVIKEIDDFTLDDYRKLFGSEANVINMIIPAEKFEGTFGSFTFSLKVIEVFADQEPFDYDYYGGDAISLYYRKDENIIMLYGNIYDFNQSL